MQSVAMMTPGAYMDIAMSGHGFFEAAYEAEKLGWYAGHDVCFFVCTIGMLNLFYFSILWLI